MVEAEVVGDGDGDDDDDDDDDEMDEAEVVDDVDEREVVLDLVLLDTLRVWVGELVDAELCVVEH